MNDSALSLTAIEKSYKPGQPGEVQVLRGASLTIARGEIVALVAPSGAGKSTLLHIAGLLDSSDAGTVALNGTDMTGLSDRKRTAARRRDIGFIYQFHHLLPEFSALENITLPQLANGVSRTTADLHARDLLTRVAIADRADHRPAELSGGEQQRVAFCRALANAPSLLLADEPTGNLDPELSADIMHLFEAFNDVGVTLLIASHDLALISTLPHRVITLDHGQLVADSADAA